MKIVIIKKNGNAQLMEEQLDDYLMIFVSYSRE